jgi:hypothetical protein
LGALYGWFPDRKHFVGTMGKRTTPCVHCKKAKKKCDMKQPCSNCLKSKTPKLCEYPDQAVVPINRLLAGLLRIGYCCGMDLVPLHPVHFSRSKELDEAFEFVSCFFANASFPDRLAKAQSLPCKLSTTLATDSFHSLEHVMDCVIALHLYGLTYFFAVSLSKNCTFDQIIVKEDVADPIYCLKKSVELTRRFLLQQSTYGESMVRVNVSEAVPLPNPYASWIDLKKLTAAERGSRMLLIALVARNDVYSALVDNERFALDEWELVETNYGPVEVQPSPYFETVQNTLWDKSMFEKDVLTIINTKERIDAISLAQTLLKNTLLFRRCVIFSRKQKYAQVSNLNLSSEQLLCHELVLKQLNMFSMLHLTENGFIDEFRPLSSLSLITTLSLLNSLTLLHFDTVSSDERFDWFGMHTMSSADILYNIFLTTIKLVKVISPGTEALPSPYFCDPYTLTDISLIATTIMAAYSTSNMVGTDRCLHIANLCKEYLFPLASKIGIVFEGAPTMFQKCSLLVASLLG